MRRNFIQLGNFVPLFMQTGVSVVVVDVKLNWSRISRLVHSFPLYLHEKRAMMQELRWSTFSGMQINSEWVEYSFAYMDRHLRVLWGLRSISSCWSEAIFGLVVCVKMWSVNCFYFTFFCLSRPSITSNCFILSLIWFEKYSLRQIPFCYFDVISQL